jgi:pimeloyl-ACP methyl ester carboxylesterase
MMGGGGGEGGSGMRAMINGVHLYYEVHGSGRPILFIHGFPLSGTMWAPLIPFLPSDFRLIIPDLRGFGQSEATATTTMAQFADDLAALLDTVGPAQPAVLVGLSMGAYIAFEFYRRHRARIAALVLADTRPEPDSLEKVQERLRTAREVSARGSAVLADAMADKLFAPSAPTELRAQWRENMASAPPMGVAAALRAMAARTDSTPLLSRIDVPTLIVVGEHDAITPPAVAEKMREAVKGSRLEIIPGAGHMPPVEAPERFASALRSFLAAVPEK